MDDCQRAAGARRPELLAENAQLARHDRRVIDCNRIEGDLVPEKQACYSITCAGRRVTRRDFAQLRRRRNSGPQCFSHVAAQCSSILCA